MLPGLIEIIPWSAPVSAEITVPGSKSITNRALILAALSQGEVTLKGALWSEDTQIMVACLQQLGYAVAVRPDLDEACNRTISVMGESGRISAGGSEEKPLDLFVGNAGTAARFLAPLLCLGTGIYRLHGVQRMHERPQAALFQALRELGYRIVAENGNDKLPVRIHGAGPNAGKCRVSIAHSSQFASALLLSAAMGGWDITMVGENAEESPYVVMTQRLLEVFPHGGGTFPIEPDASSGSYFWGAGWLAYVLELVLQAKRVGNWTGSQVFVKNWPETGWQIDADFPDFLPLPDRISREGQLADSIMTAIVLAADRQAANTWGLTENHAQILFTDLGRLRVQECERVVALKTELCKCGAKIVEAGDTLTVYPTALHGAEIETYNDHRMAMCFAILGLKVPGIKIKNPDCVKKTFPNFFQKLAGPAPQGLGTIILDAAGHKLAMPELFAD